ncbi:hypothetical protein [Parachitinimonas caeni]|uniref:Phage tail protein n=1 Tax=Parachitinimonas caeni TaxID=3031301 RepID=A0ABT7DVR6_9NEIS|nr:hypothetical protein [Parachitinimonas caeni]MDK2124146.1 hypothetical protein [Parachitinimonas caeni]
MNAVWLFEADTLDAANQPTVQRWAAGGGFQTAPSDSPPAAWFEPRVAEAFSFEANLFDKATTYGASRIGWGVLKLVNPDGRLDGLLDHAIDGRALRVYLADSRQPFAAASLAFRCRMERLKAETDTLSLEVLDRLVDLDQPLCAERLLGSDTAPNGIEGRAELKDRRKPRLYGEVANVSPIGVNPSKNLYLLCSHAATVSAVRDKGGELLADAPATSQADLETVVPAIGHYRVWSSPAGTYLRIGGNPQQITVDARSADSRCASLIQQVLREAGIAAGDISQADVDALNALQPAPVGLYVADELTALEAINRLAGSIGAWVAPDRRDVFRLGRLDAPANPILTLGPAQIVAGSLRLIGSGNDDRGLPCHTLNLEYDRNDTVQAELIGAASEAMKTWAKEATRKATLQAAAVKTRHPLAAELTQATLLRRRADAEAEAARRLALYSVVRRTWQLEAQLTAAELGQLSLGCSLTLQHPRFGLAAGKALRLIGWSPDLRAGAVTLKLWG